MTVYKDLTYSSKNTFCGDNSTNYSINVMYVPIEPKICRGTEAGTSSVIVCLYFAKTFSLHKTQCVPCPTGTLFRDGGCQACTNGQYLTARDGNTTFLTPQCVSTSVAWVPVYSRFYFDHKSLASSTKLPDSWTTECYGTCGSSGYALEYCVSLISKMGTYWRWSHFWPPLRNGDCKTTVGSRASYHSQFW